MPTTRLRTKCMYLNLAQTLLGKSQILKKTEIPVFFIYAINV